MPTTLATRNFRETVASRPVVVCQVVDNGGMKRSVGTFHIRAGSMAWSPRRALAGVVLLVSLAACGGTSSTASETTVGSAGATVPEQVQATQPTSAVSEPPPTDSEAPSNVSDTTVVAGGGGSVSVPELLQFTAPLVGGGEFKGADRAGQATAFWFWAPT